jgi:hypothetical protein
MLTVRHHFALEMLFVFIHNWFSKEWLRLDKFFHRLFNDASSIKIIRRWVVVKWKGSGRKRSWSNRDTIQAHAWRD